MDEKTSNIKERILQLSDIKGVAKETFFENIGSTYANFKGKSKLSALNSNVIAEISTKYPDVSLEWLLSGKGAVFKEPPKQNEKRKIPLFEDVGTIGGTDFVAEDVAVYNNPYSTEYIDVGDWFPKATAAIRHYNGSMKEYPSGCVLVLASVDNYNDLNWGEHYVIEYGSYRVTKELQPFDNDYIMGYSTNDETYPDGRLRYPPFKIPKYEIRRIFLVLGYVAKRYSNGFVYTNNSKI